MNRPCGALLAMVLEHVFERLDLGVPPPSSAVLDELAAIQVPVHPGVAERLSIEWATEQRVYRHGPDEVTWERFVRGYIARYG